jgi:hypothetical protein
MYCFKGTYGSFALRIRNSIIWGNATAGILKTSNLTPAVTNSITQEIYTGTNNSSADPSFANPQPAAAAPATAGDYRLTASSANAINKGDDSLYTAVPYAYSNWQSWLSSIGFSTSIVSQPMFETYIAPAIEKDLGGAPRRNTTIDMGAYEY